MKFQLQRVCFYGENPPASRPVVFIHSRAEFNASALRRAEDRPNCRRRCNRSAVECSQAVGERTAFRCRAGLKQLPISSVAAAVVAKSQRGALTVYIHRTLAMYKPDSQFRPATLVSGSWASGVSIYPRR